MYIPFYYTVRILNLLLCKFVKFFVYIIYVYKYTNVFLNTVLFFKSQIFLNFKALENKNF